MSKFIEFLEGPRGWSGRRLSSAARRALAMAVVVGAGAGMMSAQSNFAAPGARDAGGADATYSSSAGEQTEALVVAPLPDFRKMMVGAAGGHGQYGRPGYRPNYTNEDDSVKFTWYFGGGATLPVANTSDYLTPNFSFQAGVGPRFSRHFSLPIEFNWDQFGFTKSALDNQIGIYDYLFSANSIKYLLDGNSHIWSFSLQPTYTFHSGGMFEPYVKAGVGFYHKTANFTLPTKQFVCYYYCGIYYGTYNFDYYTSNAAGFDVGVGGTFRFSAETHAKLYAEVKYVFIANSARSGIVNTPASLATITDTTTNFYPANSNHTFYFPIIVGIRF